MAQTDARPGFRLPWSSDRQASDSTDGETSTDETSATGDSWPTEDATPPKTAPVDVPDASTTIDSSAGPVATPTVAPAAAPGPALPGPVLPGRKPTKFMADLTKAMAAAAEDARGRSLAQLQADAKTYVETIHGRSATEAAALRRGADDDVAAVREWSKAEIARIREETETRITDRKGRLESEIEEHAGVIEREIDAVLKTVAAFESDMAEFFESLLLEEDPSRFATMAENLPDAPSFEGIVASPVAAEQEAESAVVEPAEPETAAVVEAIADEPQAMDAEASEPVESQTDGETTGEAETVAVAVAEDDAAESTTGSFVGAEGGAGPDGEVDREAAFAAIQAAAEAAASAEVAADAAARAEAVADVAIEIMGNQETDDDVDPRFAALGLSPDYDAAEAEALAAATGSSDDEIPEIDDDALAARLAGLVPGKGKGATGDTATAQVVVVGLVSVASIASFKRHLGRVTGVQSVGVSSGPDGEFIFAVNHAADVNLRDAIPSLPSFQARVTGASDGVVHVTAHDPEADA